VLFSVDCVDYIKQHYFNKVLFNHVLTGGQNAVADGARECGSDSLCTMSIMSIMSIMSVCVCVCALDDGSFERMYIKSQDPPCDVIT